MVAVDISLQKPKPPVKITTVKSVARSQDISLLGLGLGLETNLRGGSGYFYQKSLHERTTVKSVEDHRALGLGLGLGLETNLLSWQWVFLSEKPP